MFKDIKQVMKDSVLYGIGNVAVKLVGFILIPLYTDAEYFSTADYGLMGLLEVTSQILIAVMGLSLYSGLIRWYWDAEYRDKQKTIFFTTLLFTILTSLCIGSVLWLNVGELSALLVQQEGYSLGGELPYILQLLILTSMLGAVVEVPQNLLRLQRKPIYYSLTNIVRLFVTLVLTIYFTIFLHRGVSGVYEAQLVGIVIQLLMVLPLVIKNSSCRVDRRCTIQLLAYSYPLVFPAIVGSLLTVFDRYIINHFQGLDDVGFYSLGYKVGNTLKVFIVTSVQLALTPLLMKKMNDPDNKQFYSKVLTYFSFGLMFCALGLNLFSREGIVWVTTNPDYIEALYVIPFVTYAIFFSMMRECCMIGLQIMKKTKIISYVIVGITILNFFLNMLLVPSMGMYGAALSTMIVQVISWLACYIFAQQYYPIPYELSKVGKVLVVGTILYLIGILFNETAIGISILVKLVILGGYPFLLYKWHFYDKDEWNNLKGAWKKWSDLRRLKENVKNVKYRES